MPKATLKKVVTVDEIHFRTLHSAARALFTQALGSENHSVETAVYLQLLDAAIDEGHKVLGTHRPTADNYIAMMRGITKVQEENARIFLENTALEQEDLDKSA